MSVITNVIGNGVVHASGCGHAIAGITVAAAAAIRRRRGLAQLRACESFANLWGMKGLQQVVVVLLRGWGEWSEGEPVGVGR